MPYFKLYDPGTLTDVYFPYVDYKYIESDTDDLSIYPDINLQEYLDMLSRCFYVISNDPNFRNPGQTKELFLYDEDGDPIIDAVTCNRQEYGCIFTFDKMTVTNRSIGAVTFNVNYDDPELDGFLSVQGLFRKNNDPYSEQITTAYLWNYSRGILCIDAEKSWGTVKQLLSDSTAARAYALKPRYVSVFKDFNQELKIFKKIEDPNEQGGNSGPGGGSGFFDGTSEVITIPGLPTLSAVDTGFVTLYNPSLPQIRSLASYMWSTDLIDNILKAFADPMDAILGLSIVPVAVPDGVNQNVRIGNVTSDVIMTKAASQYVSVDCGSLEVREYWGSALDYSPNTKAQLILPYIGAREIDVDEIMHKTVHIVYHVDILSGACVCFVAANNSVIYQFEGSCANQIPITGSNWTQVLTTAVQVAGNAAAFVATAGGSGAVQASTALSGLANTAGNVMNSKPRIEHSGNVTGGGGQMSVQVPYLIVQRPRQSLPVNYNKYEGYPSNITAKLADLRGFTSIESIHLEGVNATDQELEEIQQLLRGGVII